VFALCNSLCRNPLLHFSPALYRHITHDHRLPLILLLNKCDLVPAAAVAEWQQWLQQQLPGVTVIPVSAAKEQAVAAARQVLAAVLQQQVERDGVHVEAQQLVGLSLGEWCLWLSSCQRSQAAPAVRAWQCCRVSACNVKHPSTGHC
jgi:tRNA U34 5-carboxymethylaminomethyl modifying GTPase MnmE/TrmE